MNIKPFSILRYNNIQKIRISYYLELTSKQFNQFYQKTLVMDYFRQQLMSYRLDRQMSTLLHIHVEYDRPKELIHFSKSKNYVDQIINEYTVPMCSYPQLNTQDCRLSYNIFAHKKSGTNVFQLQEVKRKIAKPKNSKRDKICPCCEMKCYFRHKCDHTACEKPCKKMKSSTDPLDDSQKKKQQEEEEFTVNKQELENEESPSSKSEDLSEFSEEMEEEEQDEDVEISLQQSVSKQIKKGKKVDTRGRKGWKGWKGGRFRGKGPQKMNRSDFNQNFQESTILKKQSRGSDNIEALVKKEAEQAINNNGLQRENERDVNRQGKRKGKGKISLKNIDKDSLIQSEIQVFEPSTRRRTNPITQNKQQTEQQLSKQQEGEIPEFIFNSKQALSYFCTPEQLNSNQWFQYRIADENVVRKGRKPGVKPNNVKVDMRRTQNKIKALNMEKEQKEEILQKQEKQRKQKKEERQRKQAKQRKEGKQVKQRNFGRKKKKVNEEKKMEVGPLLPQLDQLGIPQNEPQLPKKQINLSMISVIADLNLEKSKSFLPYSQVLVQPQMNNNIKGSMENQENVELAVNASFDPIISPLDEQEAAQLFGNSDDPQQ